MATIDIDELRGAPLGHTAKSDNAPKRLREAAIAAATVMSITPMAAENTNAERDPVDDGHKIEMAVQETPTRDNGASMDFYQAESQAQSQVLNPQDINVSYEDEYFVVQGGDGSAIIMHENDLNGRRMERQENREHNQIFRQPDIIKYEIMPPETIRACIANQDYNKIALGVHNEGTTDAVVYRSPFSKEEVQQGIAQATNDGNKEDLLFWMYYDELVKMQENPELERSVLEHERTHLNDERSGVFKESALTKTQSTKIDMLAEVNATLTQVALGYNKYLQTGNLDDIQGEHAGDLKELKEWLQQNPDKVKSEECTQRIVQAVQNGWLERNNKEGTAYYAQAMNIYNMGNASGIRQAGAQAEGVANIAEYNRRVKEMFSNTLLGDVSAYINPNFVLGAGATYQSPQEMVSNMNQSERFLAATYGDAQTVREATSNVRDVFNVVRRADKDGVRTPEEQAQIDQMVTNVCANTKTMDKKTKDAITIARKTGRGWQNRSASKQDSGRTIENTNVNVAAMAAMQKGGRE